MNTSPSHTVFQEMRLPVQAKLAAAWTSFMFLYIYVDYFALYKPGFIDGLLAGTVHEFEIGPTFISLGLTLIAIPSMMAMLSMTLPARINRMVNLVVATLLIPFSAYNATGETMTYAYFYAFSIGLEVLILAFVLRSAWNWPRVAAAPVAPATGSGAEHLRMHREV
ncbi:MAG: DUF6326 family protein [Nostocoides sp.]